MGAIDEDKANEESEDEVKAAKPNGEGDEIGEDAGADLKKKKNIQMDDRGPKLEMSQG